MGNLAPEGSVIKSTAIDASLMDEDNVYRHRGPARVFMTEAAAIKAIKAGAIGQGDVIVLICGGPDGRGHAGDLPGHVGAEGVAALQACGRADRCALQRRFDGRVHRAHFAGSAGGRPIGKVLEGDQIEIVIDRANWWGSVHLVGDAGEVFGAEEGARRLAERKPRADLQPHPALPDDTRLWAALVHASGGVWGGCVYDTDKIVALLEEHT